jgi:carbamoyltransferase
VSIFLGLFDGHNASAAVLCDGRIEKAVQEERLSRTKNHFGPPVQATQKILSLLGASITDVDRVCLVSHYIPAPRDPRSIKDLFDDRYKNGVRQRLVRFCANMNLYRSMRSRQRMQQRREAVVEWGFDPDQIEFCDHHHAHAASAYYGLRKDDQPYLVLTLDGGGDGLSGSVWIGKAGVLTPVETIPQADSLGEIYAATTHYLGFMPLEHEYKLMGMAPYGADKYAQGVAQLYAGYVDLDERNPLRFARKVPEPLSRIGPRLQNDMRRVRFDNICAGLQVFTENLIKRWVRACVEKTDITRVLAAGGVFMNVKANKVIGELDGVEYFEALPSCGDETLPFGGCYLTSEAAGEETQPLSHCYLGNGLAKEECRAALAPVDQVIVEEPQDLELRTAQLLASGKIVARAAGPMEFGARALGNRSILADPINQDVVRIINRMIKNRDFWMPFAPVVRREKASLYFENPKQLPSPYMMNTFSSSQRRDEFMAAVHNADLTARPQLLQPGQNDRYEAVLKHFGDLTNRHVLLNTSFNLHGEPIVCTAKDAVRVFVNSGLDHMVLGPLLVSKRLETKC